MATLDVELGNEIFIQGKYLALGINGSGSLGTKQLAPFGISTDLINGFNRLGMLADFDGFGIGKAPTTTEAMLDGTPTEGFTIGYRIGGSTYVAQNQERVSRTSISGETSDRSAGGVAKAGWTGTSAEKLGVDQTISLTDDGKYVRVDVVLTNGSSAAMTDLRYMRSIDADHGITFGTVNKIVSQSGTGGALVGAYAGTSPFFYYAQDARAVVSTTVGYRSVDPYTAEVLTSPQAVGYSLSGDNVINIAFNIGTLSAGAQTTLTFYMGITDNLDATVAAIKAAPTVPTTPTKPTTPINVAPSAANDAFALLSGATVTGNVLGNDRDGNGDALTASVTSGPRNGTLTLNRDGTFSYKAAAGFVGTDTFAYGASDGKLSSSATVTLTVSAPPPAPVPTNTAPTAVNDAYTLAANGSVKGFVLANDSDANGDAIAAALKTGPANGTVTLATDGTFIYTPKANFSGADSFTYTASDGKAASSATVSLTVKAPANTAPVAAADSVTTAAAGTVTGNVLTNDTDAEGNALKASLKSGPANGTVTLASDGSFTYTPSAGFSGADSFTYAASDGSAQSSATVSIAVTPPPTPASDPIFTRAGTQDGSADSNQILSGPTYHNTFFVDSTDASGVDRISNFGADDVLVTRAGLYDGNGDGIIGLRNGVARLDSPTGADAAILDGVTAIRSLGKSEAGLFVYAQAGVRPRGAIEGKLGADTLTGDNLDRSKQAFFFDTALDLNLGNDAIVKFGSKDILVTTSALFDGNNDGVVSFGGDGRLALVGSSGATGDTAVAGEAGYVSVTSLTGTAVTELEIDGSMVRGDTTYYVYSLVGSSAGLDDLVF